MILNFLNKIIFIEDAVLKEDKVKRSLNSQLHLIKAEDEEKNSEGFATPQSKKRRIELLDSPSPSPSTKSDYSSDSSSSFEQGEPLELPPFTSTVKCALRDGDCNTTVWNMVNIIRNHLCAACMHACV